MNNLANNVEYIAAATQEPRRQTQGAIAGFYIPKSRRIRSRGDELAPSHFVYAYLIHQINIRRLDSRRRGSLKLLRKS